MMDEFRRKPRGDCSCTTRRENDLSRKSLVAVGGTLLLLAVYKLPVATASVIPDRCHQPPERGDCTDYVHKWFYSNKTGKCETFIYGGCRGNDNKFDSENECSLACVDGFEPPEYMLPEQKTKDEKPPVTHSTTTSTTVSPYMIPKTTLPPVPINQRGPELTFEETGHHKVFMFAKRNTYIQLDGNHIPNFQLRLCRQISFQFRTRLPHGLLVYHSVKNRPEGLDPYALYVIVEKGQLKVVHVFGKESTSLTVGEALNDDQWHSVQVLIDVHRTRLIAKVDKEFVETHIKGLDPATNYGVSNDLTSVVLIGGLSSEEKLHGVKYIIESFVGCIQDMILSAGKAASDLLPIKPLIATKHENVVESCINKCKTRENLCFFGSQCVNHYNTLTCDCFGTKYEGEQCDIYTATTLTFRGSSYVSYRVYDWKDRVHSNSNRISLQFKTYFDDSALFYASGEPGIHYIAVSIKNRVVHIEINLGNEPIITTMGDDVTANYWNNLTIIHNENLVRIYCNTEAKEFELSGTKNYLYIDPEIYIGGGPELHKKTGLASHNNFVGSLKYVFFNEISILYELKKGNPKVHYIGVLEPEFEETKVEVIPLTLPFPSAHIKWYLNDTDTLSLKFDFKSSQPTGVLAVSNITTPSGHGYWELKLVNDDVRFVLRDLSRNFTHQSAVKYVAHVNWHHIDINYKKGYLNLTVDYLHNSYQLIKRSFRFEKNLTIGTGIKLNQGLVGCVRLMMVNGESIEPRYVVRSKHAVGDVSIDNCQLVDPCKRPNACEHGGRCSVKDDHILCDCSDTGYIGKNCHFALHRKTCEELALLGYTKPSVYWIDIDGNGRFPPAHVKCEFQATEDATKTIVEHNLPSQTDVRSLAEKDFKLKIQYREFSPEMLQELISHSLRCSQHIKYDCYKAPLELHSATWFQSSANKQIVDYIGDVKKGTCPCAVNKTCIDPKQSCNCDANEARWHTDEGLYTSPNTLGITDMIFLQQKELVHDSQGRITLGPLECVETNTQKYVVTFTSSQSYIEVPGWRKGDISFSFRTTGEKAILLYQPPIRPNHPSFMVALTDDFTLTFNFTLNNGSSKVMEIKSGRKLNGGEWQKIWIDYNEHHVRFMINTETKMVDLAPDEEFGPFEGSMFIGGAPEDLLKMSTVKQGLIGCFRGLVVNGEVLDIYSYMSVHLSEIIKDCKPSCVPNPCKNGAQCKELWSTFQCICENPWAHRGPLCETNINVNGLTFVTKESYFKRNYLQTTPDDDYKKIFTSVLTKSFLINLRTYDKNSLVLYANDHLNNFVHLHIENGSFVVFMFNSDNVIQNITVEYPGLNSGKSVQVAIIRTPELTTMHVNEKNNSLHTKVMLLTKYSNIPWINRDKEILSPQRPPAPPTEYFQINLGGYKPIDLKSNPAAISLSGYVGCIRGFSVDNKTVDFSLGKDPVENGIKIGCKMKCDEVPCKNQGICIEDFSKGESTCNCEYTSYYGESCSDEKGSEFEGESAIKRKYILDGPVEQVKVQLAFSSSFPHKTNTVLLLLQTEHKRNYNLLVSLSSNGHLTFREDQEGSSLIANVADRNFLNGARHSVYFQRKNDNTTKLLIDQENIKLEPTGVLSLSDLPTGEQGANEVQVGGLNTTDPRFTAYKSFNGCLSNVFVEVNSYSMKPLEEYMLFTKAGSKEINVVNPQGIRMGQCSVFDWKYRPISGPALNNSQELDDVPFKEGPQKEEYKSLYTERSAEEDSSSTIVFLVMAVLFVVIVLGALCEVYRSHRKHKRRQEAEVEAAIRWPKSQKFQDPGLPSSLKMTGYKSIPVQDTKPKQPLESKPVARNEYKPIPDSVPDEKKPSMNGESKTKIDNTDKELAWEPLNENTGLLQDKSIEDLSQKIPNDVGHESRNADNLSERPGQGQRADGNINGVSSVSQVSSPPPFPPIPEERVENRDMIAPGSTSEALKPRLTPGAKLSPIFLNEERRTFENPISYLGGPRLHSSVASRDSKESVLSLD
ncbi:neurexin-4 isoform X1 [Schistocerca piceifrons]|uniref:neurexin-4 isoform X1 n=1 Tax=Schistocerca piceifrons TaxID=274613 RepID=UPI001F5E85B4|nr:neurexin-4 isoform X1 [Schistocerca piceifrons]XP_047111391.1 neurexin-4 isoform X1 [Schistocerca piceifrons]